jgi:hypothetical protein
MMPTFPSLNEDRYVSSFESSRLLRFIAARPFVQTRLKFADVYIIDAIRVAISSRNYTHTPLYSSARNNMKKRPANEPLAKLHAAEAAAKRARTTKGGVFAMQ